MLALVLCAGCGSQKQAAVDAGTDLREHSFSAMNTYITMQANGPDAEEALLAAEELVRRQEEHLSVTREGSEIYAANHSGGVSVTLSRETAELLALTLDMARQTGGALDPTIYPVLTAWSFTTESRQVPAQAELDALLPLVDYTKITLSDHTVTVPDGMALDLGAVAKGDTGDRAAALLREQGVTSGLLSLGGNVQAIGRKPDGSPWRIGVRNPFSEENLGVLEVAIRVLNYCW